jgi:hypothetical protein
MFKDKSGPQHPIAGKRYFLSMSLSFFTVIVLSVMRWPHNIHLLVIGALAYALTYIGRRVAKNHMRHGTGLHTICMGCSYILLITGFYVDNGKNLPFWRMFPSWFFWIFPAAIGIPIIVYTLKKHPLNRRKHHKKII